MSRARWSIYPVKGLKDKRVSTKKQAPLTVSEVAISLQVTTEHIRKLIRQGRLSAINIGTGGKRPLYRVTPQALNKFLECQTTPIPKRKVRRHKQLAPVPDYFPHLK